MSQNPNSTRRVPLIVATIVAIMTVAIVAHATTTITVPNAITRTYALGAGGVSAALALPTDRPLQIIGIDLTAGDRGVGQVAAHASAGGGFIVWTGLESP